MVMLRDRLALVITALLLLGAAAGYVVTDPGRSSATRADSLARGALVDRRPLRMAQRVAPLATTREEQALARDALRLGDHVVDLGFAVALLEAAEHRPAPTAETRSILARIDSTQRLIAQDSARLARLRRAGSSDKAPSGADVAAARTSAARTPERPAQPTGGSAGPGSAAAPSTPVTAASAAPDGAPAPLEADLLEAQLELYRGQLADARDDLLRAGGDPQARIRQMRADHDSAEHGAAPQLKVPTAGARADTARGLMGTLERWRALQDKRAMLERAQRQTTAAIARTTARYQERAAHFAEVEQAAATDLLAKTRHLASDRRLLAGLNGQIEDEVSLLDVYSRWSTVAGGQRRAVLHDIFLAAVWLLLIVLVVVAVGAWLERLVARLVPERRRQHTVRTVIRFGLRALGLAGAALVLFGPPSQLATIIGLAGAGLTVVMKDFIVGFFGWFALMGRNGIRIGDWVEINGVSGEVIEMTPFHTVLLETGNWTEAGHPTGRQVRFSNAFAIEGHYFNFSTSGQWLWDEVELELPTADAPAAIEAIRATVTAETEENARLAEQEWSRATASRAVSGFSAAPAIDVRPSPGGMRVMVRYITHARDRHRLRTRLYQVLADLVGQAAAVR
ncbi:MAG TPA: mechanosensitive ion channel domain-containing protein [Gemmatimonadales bacterium]|nr:mechanosensitive ion channel domain-containing protein [Gemmatimonadales bacterium]